MTIFSIRLPEDIAGDLKKVAQQRGISVNKLTNELYAQLLAEEAAKQQFLAAQLRGDPKKALRMLDELDAMGI